MKVNVQKEMDGCTCITLTRTARHVSGVMYQVIHSSANCSLSKFHIKINYFSAPHHCACKIQPKFGPTGALPPNEEELKSIE